MTHPSFATHEVFNQSPPFEDVDLFVLDQPLVDAVAANGGAAAGTELSEFGQHWGAAAMAARGRVANENTPKLRTFDDRGVRRAEGEVSLAFDDVLRRDAMRTQDTPNWSVRKLKSYERYASGARLWGVDVAGRRLITGS